MEQFFKLTQHIILEKNSEYKANSKLLKKCKEIDNLIEKRFVFEDKPKIRQTLLHWGYELTKEDFDTEVKSRQ